MKILQRIYLNSKEKVLLNDRIEFQITIPQLAKYIGIRELSLKMVEYNVNSNNNILRIQKQGTDEVITLPQGHHSIYSLCEAVPQLSFNAITYSVTFTGDSHFSISPQSTCLELLGFIGEQSSILKDDKYIIEGGNCPDLSYPFIKIDIDQFTSEGVDENQQPLSFLIHQDQPSSSTTIKRTNGEMQLYPIVTSFNQLSVFIKDGDGKSYNFRGVKNFLRLTIDFFE